MIEIPPHSVLKIFLGGVALFFVLRLFHLLLRRLPDRRIYRPLNQLMAIVEIITWPVLALLSVQSFFTKNPSDTPFVLLPILLFFLSLSWFAIRDLFAGIILKAEDLYRIGDPIRIKDISGVIRRLGFRSLVIETETGERVKIPYASMTTDMIVRPMDLESDNRLKFKVEVPKFLSLTLVCHKLRRTLYNTPWSSLTREPTIRTTDEDLHYYFLEITVYPLHADYLPNIENVLRDQIRILVEGANRSHA